jgi:hypothetical protein
MAHWKEAMGMSSLSPFSLGDYFFESFILLTYFLSEGKPRIWRPGQKYTGHLNRTE